MDRTLSIIKSNPKMSAAVGASLALGLLGGGAKISNVAADLLGHAAVRVAALAGILYVAQRVSLGAALVAAIVYVGLLCLLYKENVMTGVAHAVSLQNPEQQINPDLTVIPQEDNVYNTDGTTHTVKLRGSTYTHVDETRLLPGGSLEPDALSRRTEAALDTLGTHEKGLMAAFGGPDSQL